MASSTSLFLSFPLKPSTTTTTSPRHHSIITTSRRRSLLLLVSAPLLSLSLPLPLPSSAADIPLFGIRKKLQNAEEAVEKEVEVVEKEVEAVEEEVGGALGFAFAGDLVQAGAVAGAEAVGVLVGVSVVNGILAPQGE